ncbi:ABC transporter permease [Myxococcota bacterium]|nr:ABC transporter permease [Myxococcota bacterium]MBU1430175.1 ABC transporter permease [Myxococcota bacterium]MBU1900068.1 ABC transporter permease [Myxococcota bacterium]
MSGAAWRDTRATIQLGIDAARASLRAPWGGAAVYEQMYAIGNRSALFILITQGFLGAILNLQSGYQALRVLGDASMIGEQLLPLLIRQLGPTLTGLMIATRVATGIAAELGSMKVTEQIDALRMCNASPVDFLVKPRLIASIMMVPVLTILGILSAFIVGAATVYAVFGTNPRTYATFDQITLLDPIECMLKALSYGALIPIIASAAGLAARGGSEGVGEATTRAVVSASLTVILVDFLIGGALFPFRI